MFRRQLALFLLLLAAAGAQAWTDKGHSMLPELALKLLPADVPVLRAYARMVADAGPEPDRWRIGRPPIKDAQEPDHYINLDMVAFLPQLPPTRHKFIEAIYAEAARTRNELRPENVGYQPYIVAEVFERLRVGFAEYSRLKLLGQPAAEAEQRIAFYAGWLSHYVTDGAQPLHANKNYDGWVDANPEGFTTQRGIHNRFEGVFVEENISAAEVMAVPPKRAVVHDLVPDYVAYLQESAGHVRRLYELDKAGGFTGQGTPESRQFVLERMAAGRDMLAAVWTAAWQQSRWEGCIPFTEAPAHASQFGCVTGLVVGTGQSSRPGATAASLHLNFCEDYRNCALSVTIPAAVRSRFPDAEALKGKRLRFTGIVGAAERPVMVVTDPAQVAPLVH